MKKEITHNHQVRKIFSYALDNLKLEFVLRTDTEGEILVFLKLLDEARNELLGLTKEL